MLFGGNLGAHFHAQLLLHAAQPPQALRTHALEGARVRTRLPDAGTVNVNAKVAETLCRFHHLLLGLCRTGAGDAHGTRKGEKAPFGSGDDI